MSLIKCPECNHDVSTEAEKCPNCGYPIAKDRFFERTNAHPPKDNGWIYKYREKAIITKTIQIFINLCIIALFIYYIELLNTDKEAVVYSWGTYYNEKPQWLALTLIFGFLTFFAVIITVSALISVKYRVFAIDGYNVVMYAGVFKIAFIIEGEFIASEFDSMFHATYIDGELPNGRKVYSRYCWGSMRVETKPF